MGRLDPGVGDGKLSVTQFSLSRSDPGQWDGICAGCCAGGVAAPGAQCEGESGLGGWGEHFALLKCQP